MQNPSVSKSDQILVRRVKEMLHKADLSPACRPAFTGFLSLREQGIVRQALGKRYGKNTLFFGGYPAGERVVFGVFPTDVQPQQSDFPILALRFLFRLQHSLSHRDFLGAVLALGLSRSTVGDILVDSSSAVGFFTPTAAELVSCGLTLVGRTGVTVVPYQGEALPAPLIQELALNVASRRLDCLVAALGKLSRQHSCTHIRGGLVCLNGMPVLQPDTPVPADTILSMRGLGRFWIGGDAAVTKKDRLRIFCKQYL